MCFHIKVLSIAAVIPPLTRCELILTFTRVCLMNFLASHAKQFTLFLR